jgi:uncharacterized protein YndB with AHSA1/START domain
VTQDEQHIAPASIVKTIDVACSPDRAFAIFAGRMGEWWHKEHSIAKGTTQTDVIVEPHAGGRWYEVGADGSEHIWGQVLEYDPPRRLLLVWQLNREFAFDPDLHTEVDVRFEPHGGGTRIHFEHRFLERMGEGTVELLEGMDGGWGMLLDLFKAKAEQPA